MVCYKVYTCTVLSRAARQICRKNGLCVIKWLTPTRTGAAQRYGTNPEGSSEDHSAFAFGPHRTFCCRPVVFLSPLLTSGLRISTQICITRRQVAWVRKRPTGRQF